MSLNTSSTHEKTIGLDVHAKSITIALVESGGDSHGSARLYGTIPNDLHALEKVFAKLKKAHPGAELRVCYEAGPTGFVLARRCAQLKIPCMVVAPSLIPVRSGERIKTDRRDGRVGHVHRAQLARPQQPCELELRRLRGDGADGAGAIGGA